MKGKMPPARREGKMPIRWQYTAMTPDRPGSSVAIVNTTTYNQVRQAFVDACNVMAKALKIANIQQCRISDHSPHGGNNLSVEIFDFDGNSGGYIGGGFLEEVDPGTAFDELMIVARARRSIRNRK